MKKHILLILFISSLYVVAVAQTLQAACRIIAYTDCEGTKRCKTLSLFEQQGEHFVQTATLEPEPGYQFYFPTNGAYFQQYSIAPNHRRIALQEVSATDPLPIENFSWIFVYDIDETFQLIDNFGDGLLAEGNIWSNDSNKLLFWDAWGHYILIERDFVGTENGELWPELPIRSVRALRVNWSPEGSYIAVMGDEHPFPVSKHALNDVMALYIAQPEIGATVYTPISDPNHSVDWYYSGVEWISEDRIAYTDGGVRVATTSGEIMTSIEGNYRILGKVFNDKLLIGSPQTENLYSLSAFDTDTEQLTPIIDLPTDEISPFPLSQFSPDFRYIVYSTLVGNQLVIKDLQTGSSSEFTAPLEENLGWWTPDSQSLLFWNYADNTIHKYDVTSQTLTRLTASDLFMDFDTLPLYPNWLCQQ